MVSHGVKVLSPLPLSSTVPYHASQLYARNVANFVVNLVKKGQLQLDGDDEIVRESMITRGGDVVHPRGREVRGRAAAEKEDGGRRRTRTSAAPPAAR